MNWRRLSLAQRSTRKNRPNTRCLVFTRRDVLAHVKREFDLDRVHHPLLAIKADTDNTGESTRSGFVDLHFVAKNATRGFSNNP
jgi:hypothetical protein